MTGMDAADRIPLLERELLRIQNELKEARAEAGGERERVWAELAGLFEGERQNFVNFLDRKLDELLGGD